MIDRAEPLSVAPEFSRVVSPEAIQAGGIVREIEASPAECCALSARFSLQAVSRLSATLRLDRVDGSGMVRVRGTLSAEVIQTCVVTLEPVRNTVVEEFGALFAPAALMPDPSPDIVIDPLADEDLPELMPEGGIDIGELTAQHFSLALDPYPRRPGIAFAGLDDDDDGLGDAGAGAPAAASPFQVLARLKQ